MIKCNLATIRRSKMISQQKLSDELHLRLPSVSKMENNRLQEYSIDTLNKLCAYFNCSLSDLLEYVPDNEALQPQEQNIQEPVGEILTSDESELLSVYRNLSDIDKQKLRDVLKIIIA